jgi:hypothetical protein
MIVHLSGSRLGSKPAAGVSDITLTSPKALNQAHEQSEAGPAHPGQEDDVIEDTAAQRSVLQIHVLK